MQISRRRLYTTYVVPLLYFTLLGTNEYNFSHWKMRTLFSYGMQHRWLLLYVEKRFLIVRSTASLPGFSKTLLKVYVPCAGRVRYVIRPSELLLTIPIRIRMEAKWGVIFFQNWRMVPNLVSAFLLFHSLSDLQLELSVACTKCPHGDYGGA